MSRIFWDTNLFVYLLEENLEFSPIVAHLKRRMTQRGDELLTSTMTLGEVQVKPREKKDMAAAERYRNIIRQTSTILPFDVAAADIYAELRSNSSVKAPDAIQLSCAAAAGVELFITNDKSLHRLNVPGIHFVTSLDRLPSTLL
jgi:predicted nucleic acid-binding protein